MTKTITTGNDSDLNRSIKKLKPMDALIFSMAHFFTETKP